MTDAVTIHHGDCLDVLTTLASNSVDAVVTDPPYGLVFMGKVWDDHADGKTFQAWCQTWAAECLRVLKPGGHLFAFGGTRTSHRLTCAVEDAGFEIRDSIAWLYGSGFPKSLSVDKAIDRTRDDHDSIVKVTTWLKAQAEAAGISRGDVDRHMGTSDMGGWWLTGLRHRCQIPTWDQWLTLRALIRCGDDMDAEVWRLNGRKGTPGEAWEARPITQAEVRPLISGDTISFDQRSSTERERRDVPATDHARTWQGWGTALKPAHEPIVVARKPLAGTVAANVLAWGTGAINVDACRVGTEPMGGYEVRSSLGRDTNAGGEHRDFTATAAAGRWPTNVVLDTDTAQQLDREVGHRPGSHAQVHVTKSRTTVGGGLGPVLGDDDGYGDSGGPSRFFPVFRYEAKAPTVERPRGDDTTAHPTVKPLDLMRWLVRLVTPPGGLVLDPFAGSGTTAEACIIEGFRCIAIEREVDYIPLIEARVKRRHGNPYRPLARPPKPSTPGVPSLFDLEPL